MNRGLLYAAAFSLALSSGCKLLQREISADMSAALAQGIAENPRSDQIHPSFFAYGKTFISLDESGRILIEFKECHKEQLENFIASLHAHSNEETYTYEDDLLVDPLDEQDSLATGLTLTLQEDAGLDIFSSEGVKLATIDKSGFIVFGDDIRSGQVKVISGFLQYILEDCPVFNEDDSYQQKKMKVFRNKPRFMKHISQENTPLPTNPKASNQRFLKQRSIPQTKKTTFKQRRYSVSGKKAPRA